MTEKLFRLMPNVMNNLDGLMKASLETIFMVLSSGLISLFFGLFLGLVLAMTKEGKILENKSFNSIINKLVDVFRSIPFIILLTALIPLTRKIVGTAIGTKGAIIPLIFATIPFLARQVETALLEVDPGLIEAALSMGSSPGEIIFRVYLREARLGIVRGITISLISLINLSAMAGSIGGGGLGDFAIRYGYQMSQKDVTYFTIVILLLLVSIIQKIGNMIIKRMSH